MSCWFQEAIFYHIYPLGFCGALKQNDFLQEPVSRLNKVCDWIEHIKYLGADSIYFGPLFESTSHGYDTADYRLIDRRLGDNKTFVELVNALHQNGIRVIVDSVFNHVGRDFWAFKDVLANGRKSDYCDWFGNLDFYTTSRLNDPFDYDTWRGHYNLVKLNLNNPEVKEYLFETVKTWLLEFNIDGLRLDCADCLDFDFMRELSAWCKAMKSDFWLLGEVIHGDYTRWVNKDMLDSVTNYVCYKGLYSSLNDRNYFEIAYTLNRQFGRDAGTYKNLCLYNFVDNHDVNRIASILKNAAHLYPLHVLLFTIPGIPSIYYGSEWGIDGKKKDTDDDLRPDLDLSTVSGISINKDLARTIAKLAQIRKNSRVLMYGEYIQLMVKSEQFAYARKTQSECIVVVLNASGKSIDVEIELPVEGVKAVDILNNDEPFVIQNRTRLKINVYPCWARILKINSL